MGKHRLEETTTAADQDRRQTRRDRIERILDYADHLAPADRDLLWGIYDRGMTAAALARAARRNPRQVQHRVRVLTRRLASPVFQFVLRNSHRWPSKRRRVADAIVLKGATQRRTAARLGMTIHSVRREIDRTRFQLELEQPQPLAASRSPGNHEPAPYHQMRHNQENADHDHG